MGGGLSPVSAGRFVPGHAAEERCRLYRLDHRRCQLGLTGDWADKPIQTFGHAPSGASRFFEWNILHNSDKWNPNYRGYVETGSKMIAESDRATQQGGIRYMLEHELAPNRYAIAWT